MGPARQPPPSVSRVGVGRAAGRRHARASPVGADQIFRRNRLVGRQRRRIDRNVADEQPAGAREPFCVFRHEIGRARAARHTGGEHKQRQQRFR